MLCRKHEEGHLWINYGMRHASDSLMCCDCMYKNMVCHNCSFTEMISPPSSLPLLHFTLFPIFTGTNHHRTLALQSEIAYTGFITSVTAKANSFNICASSSYHRGRENVFRVLKKWLNFL